ncbi:MAG: phosphoribosylaminoimidazolesuccinocarboxamide synthase [Candidatus Dormibacteraceae bacterium]
MNPPALVSTDLPLPLFRRGKVRDTYRLADHRLLMVSTDRISAFDWVLPNGIPDRGRVLTQLSTFWFNRTADIVGNHLLSDRLTELPPELASHQPALEGRCMIVRQAQRIDFECVVRGYLAGSAWAEYSRRGTLAGESLPAGLRQSQRLAQPIFSPATKNDNGHDENIPFSQLEQEVGVERAAELRRLSLRLYEFGAEAALARGLILADTKFEFGIIDGEVVLIDEVLTPDSSRYWEAEKYQVGSTPESYDKQPIRDWLAESEWDKNSPPPAMPEEVAEAARLRYLTAYRRLTGDTPPVGAESLQRFQAQITVLPRPTVNDPQGLSVQRGIHSLGFQEVGNVRVGKHIQMDLEAQSEAMAAARVEKLCKALLANQVIEDFSFELKAAERSTAQR